MHVHVYKLRVCAGAHFHYLECLCMLIQLKMWKAIPVNAKASSFADEVLSGSTDLCCITKNLTEFLLDRDEETMRFLDKICCVHMPSCTEDM